MLSTLKYSRIFQKNFRVIKTPQIYVHQNGGRGLSSQENNLIKGRFSDEDKAEFMKCFPIIVEDITKSQYLIPVQDMKRFENCFTTFLTNGKLARGLTTVFTYKFLEKSEYLTPENIKLAHILGWCTEIISAYQLIIDDMVDNSTTRRNQICWHIKEGIEKTIVDISVFSDLVSMLLKKYFSTHPMYNQIKELMSDCKMKVEYGGRMDLMQWNPEDISIENYRNLAKWKTGTSVYESFTLGMYLSKSFNTDIHRKIKPIIFDIGEMYQVNNDFDDCFGRKTVTGKNPTDVESGRCTWLAVKALEKCTPSQRKLFEQNYGKAESEAIEAIYNLYRELGLAEEYQKYENKFFIEMNEKITNLEEPYRQLFQGVRTKLQRQFHRVV